MKHVIGKRNGKTIVSGGGSLEEQKNNLKHWEVLDSVGGEGPKANFAITDPVYYINKDDIYTILTGDYYKTQEIDSEALAGNASGDNYRIYRGIGALANGFPEGISVTAEVYLGIPDEYNKYKSVIDYQTENFPETILKRSEVYAQKYPYFDYSSYSKDFFIGSLNTTATLSTDETVSEFSGGHHITVNGYDSLGYPTGKIVDYIVEANPAKLTKFYSSVLYTAIIIPVMCVKGNAATGNIIIQ